MNVVVVGAGKMGLPLACQFAKNGASVVACDVNEKLVAAINRGEPPFEEPGLAEILASGVKAGRLRATTDTPSVIPTADVIVIIVPAVLTADRDIDASLLEAVSRQVAKGLKKGAMVSYETTVPVGCTRSRFVPILETSGMVAGRDFDVVFSPERVKSQFLFRNLTVNPKVVGGLDDKAAARAAEFYGAYLGAPVTNVRTLEAAEMVKVAGMAYRDLNIALANELARYSELAGVDLPALLPAINSDGEAHLLSPGIGVGGHCTPVYPYFMMKDAERRGMVLTLMERARRLNDEQASFVVGRAERLWGSLKGKKVAVLGLAFRPEVKEHICSTTFLLVEDLERRGAVVRVVDPLYTDGEIAKFGFAPGTLSVDAPADVVVLQVAHAAFAALDAGALAKAGVKLVVDGRNAWDAAAMEAAGMTYVGVGRPSHAKEPAKVLPIAKPLLGGAEAEAASRVVRSGWIMQGPEVALFETEFASYVGSEHALAVSSGTAALHLALLALGVGPGDEVITVSHSFVATANCISLCGAAPVFVDIERGTYNLDPNELEKAITPKTKAVLTVHQLGMPSDLTKIAAFCKARSLFLVEDAACAVGSEIEFGGAWAKIGAPLTDAACFSFHPRKILTTGDGGMITFRDESVARKAKILRQHGLISAEAKAECVAYNYRLTDVQAAIGREQLRRMPSLVAERREQRLRYDAALAGLGLTPPKEPAWARSNFQSYCFVLPLAADRDAIQKQLASTGVSTRGGVANSHEQPAYPNRTERLPVSEEVTRHALMLPLFPGMDVADQDRVIGALSAALGKR